ncbi:hypothetical protein [Herbidospora cretacea]|uniref:hypothetical protein n=1 Tax=Herbidospora cretacea TaxID=28444 RepID=UPI0012DE5EB2|nr:hypothetical protein [Herbidospora cretacea]
MTNTADRGDVILVIRWICRARSLHLIFAALVILGLATAIWGSKEVILPGMEETVPLGVLLPVPYACISVLSLRCAMSDFGRIAARQMRLIDVGVLVTSALATLAIAAIALFLGGIEELIPLMMRNTIFWLGIACISAGLLGRSLSWVMPILLFLPLYEFGKPGVDGNVAWWAIARQPPASIWAGIAACAILIVGIVVALEPYAWRRGFLHMLLRRL